MADAPADRSYILSSVADQAKRCAPCGKPVKLGEFSLVRLDVGMYEVQCYDCRPARDAQPARLSGGP